MQTETAVRYHHTPFRMIKMKHSGTSLAVQWLRLHTPNAVGTGLIPGRGAKIPHATPHGQKKKKERKKHSDTIKCWHGCGETGSLTHCWQECKMVQPL